MSYTQLDHANLRLRSWHNLEDQSEFPTDGVFVEMSNLDGQAVQTAYTLRLNSVAVSDPTTRSTTTIDLNNLDSNNSTVLALLENQGFGQGATYIITTTVDDSRKVPLTLDQKAAFREIGVLRHQKKEIPSSLDARVEGIDVIAVTFTAWHYKIDWAYHTHGGSVVQLGPGTVAVDLRANDESGNAKVPKNVSFDVEHAWVGANEGMALNPPAAAAARDVDSVFPEDTFDAGDAGALRINPITGLGFKDFDRVTGVAEILGLGQAEPNLAHCALATGPWEHDTSSLPTVGFQLLYDPSPTGTADPGFTVDEEEEAREEEEEQAREEEEGEEAHEEEEGEEGLCTATCLAVTAATTVAAVASAVAAYMFL